MSTTLDRQTGMDEMETDGQSKRSGRGHRGGPEPRVVRIEYRPVPDAERRLRRLAEILLDHATRAASLEDDGERPEVR